MYQVHVVPDEDLPFNRKRVLVQLADGTRLLIMSRTAAEEAYPLHRIDSLDPACFNVHEALEDDEVIVLQEVVNGG